MARIAIVLQHKVVYKITSLLVNMDIGKRLLIRLQHLFLKRALSLVHN